jgi:SAM (Sterile alpha motif) domain-containing protein
MATSTRAHSERVPAARKGEAAMDRLEARLNEAGLGEHVAAFRAERIAPDQLSEMTDADLRELGLVIASASGRPSPGWTLRPIRRV